MSITCTPGTNVTALSVYTDASGSFTELVQNSSEVSGAYEFTSVNVDEGEHIFACVENGNIFSENRTITKDTTNPTLSVDTINATSATVNVNYMAQDTNLDTCFYNVNNGANNTMTNCANTTISLNQGTQTLNVFAQDKATNTVSQSQDITVTADTTAPTVSSLTAKQERTAKDEVTVTIFATTNENATCKYDNFDESYNSMEDSFDNTGATEHNSSIRFSTEVERTYYVRCKDVFANKMGTSEEITFNTTIGPEATLEKSSSRYIFTQSFVEQDEKVIIEIEDDDFITKKVTIDVNKQLQDVEIRIKELDKKPSALPKLDNEAVRFIKFNLENIDQDDIDTVSVLINTELTNNIYLYDDDMWKEQNAQQFGNSLQVDLDSLTYLAVTTNVQSIAQIEETQEETTNVTVQEEKEEKEPFKLNIDKGKLIWWFSIIALIAVLAGLGYFFKQHRKEFYGEE